MSEWNVFYRAFLDYKKKTAEDKNIKRLLTLTLRHSVYLF